MNLTRILLLIAFSTFAAETPAVREWTSLDGRKVQAALAAVRESEVVLRMADGKDYPVPISRLSAADQEWLKNQLPNKVAEASTGTQGGKTQARPDTPAAERTWPRMVALPEAPEPKVVLEDEAGRRFVYQTEHYEFECDSKLSTKAVKDLSRVFEATWLLNCKLPLDLRPMPEEGRELFKARLFTEKGDFFKAGGLTGSAGSYIPAQKEILVPLASLGTMKTQGSKLSFEARDGDDNRILIHEITHQMMGRWWNKLPVWYREGSADVAGSLNYNYGRFSMTSLSERLKDFVVWKGFDPKRTELLSIEQLVNMSGAAWNADLSSVRRERSRRNYMSACLLAGYFYFYDGKGDSAGMIAYLREIESSRERNAHLAAFQKHLLRGRALAQLEEDVRKAYKSQGINIISFTTGTGPDQAK